MPNLDGTGPLGQGLGRSLGKGIGRGSGVRAQGGTKECTCPKCGYKESHTRGIPCSTKTCPKCQTQMKGVYCL